MSTPKLRYQKDLARDGFVADSAQQQAVEYLDDLYHRLCAAHSRPAAGVLGKLMQKLSTPVLQPEQGLYLWGGVGRGKTYLMDNFYESLPFDRKMRVHFHRFMRRVHEDLKRYAGQPDPLKKVADKIADETYVICFDEFFVTDITDAMILGLLLEALFARGVCLVATSNIPTGSMRMVCSVSVFCQL